MYGFEGEVKAKYSANMCDLFTEVYNWLPLCHCLNNRVSIIIIFYSPPGPRDFIILFIQYYSVICLPSDHTGEAPRRAV